ncbi:MAG: Ig-like domain-containing protein [Myxococcota bacterium]|nr:Ig-like domain-containing protein [Myxococcota bacterium]
MLLLLLACSADWEPAVDPLQVLAWAPTVDAPGTIDTPLHLSFNARLDSQTLDSIALLNAQEQVVPADISAEGLRPTLWVEPERSLQPGATYTLVLDVGLEGVGGQLLGGPVQVPFATLGPDDAPEDTGEPGDTSEPADTGDTGD